VHKQQGNRSSRDHRQQRTKAARDTGSTEHGHQGTQAARSTTSSRERKRHGTQAAGNIGKKH
jgi:hypothetical protein